MEAFRLVRIKEKKKKKLKKLEKILEKVSGIWKKETGYKYVRKMRKEWE